MHTDPQELAETYRGYSDTEIASLHAQIDSLTPEAREALAIEIDRRGLKNNALSKLFATEQRHEASFDRFEKTRRKKLAISLFLGSDPKLTIIALGGGIVLIMLAEVLRRFR